MARKATPGQSLVVGLIDKKMSTPINGSAYLRESWKVPRHHLGNGPNILVTVWSSNRLEIICTVLESFQVRSFLTCTCSIYIVLKALQVDLLGNCDIVAKQ